MQDNRHGMVGPHMGGMGMGAFAALPVEIDSPSNSVTPAKVELGRLLYFEKQLSAGRNVSCNSCHDLAAYGVDHEATSTGDKNQKGSRNSPTVYNAAAHFVQFWDGRSATIEEQAKGPILNPVEMAMPSEAAAVAAVQAVPEYADRFREASPVKGILSTSTISPEQLVPSRESSARPRAGTAFWTEIEMP
jgi:cytochrome c peroxidase